MVANFVTTPLGDTRWDLQTVTSGSRPRRTDAASAAHRQARSRPVSTDPPANRGASARSTETIATTAAGLPTSGKPTRSCSRKGDRLRNKDRMDYL